MNRLRSARKRAGLTQEDVAKAAGVSRPAVVQWESGESVSIKGENLIRVAKCLGVDPAWLVYESNTSPFVPPNFARLVPLISWVKAGDWSEASDPYAVGDAEEWIPYYSKCGENTFAVRVSGISMEPEFKDGEVIIVDPSIEARHNSYVVVRMEPDNSVTFKQLVVESTTRYLRPLNPQWHEQLIEIDGNTRICGVVIGKQTSYL